MSNGPLFSYRQLKCRSKGMPDFRCVVYVRLEDTVVADGNVAEVWSQVRRRSTTPRP